MTAAATRSAVSRWVGDGLAPLGQGRQPVIVEGGGTLDQAHLAHPRPLLALAGRRRQGGGGGAGGVGVPGAGDRVLQGDPHLADDRAQPLEIGKVRGGQQVGEQRGQRLLAGVEGLGAQVDHRPHPVEIGRVLEQVGAEADAAGHRGDAPGDGQVVLAGGPDLRQQGAEQRQPGAQLRRQAGGVELQGEIGDAVGRLVEPRGRRTPAVVALLKGTAASAGSMSASCRVGRQLVSSGASWLCCSAAAAVHQLLALRCSSRAADAGPMRAVQLPPPRAGRAPGRGAAAG